MIILKCSLNKILLWSVSANWILQYPLILLHPYHKSQAGFIFNFFPQTPLGAHLPLVVGGVDTEISGWSRVLTSNQPSLFSSLSPCFHPSLPAVFLCCHLSSAHQAPPVGHAAEPLPHRSQQSGLHWYATPTPPAWLSARPRSSASLVVLWNALRRLFVLFF